MASFKFRKWAGWGGVAATLIAAMIAAISGYYYMRNGPTPPVTKVYNNTVSSTSLSLPTSQPYIAPPKPVKAAKSNVDVVDKSHDSPNLEPATSVSAPKTTGPQVYYGDSFVLTLENCATTGAGTECNLLIDPPDGGRVGWWYGDKNELTDEEGSKIPADWMSMAGKRRSIDSIVVTGDGMWIESHTRLTIGFSRQVEPSKIRSLTVALRNGGGTHRFETIPWK